MPEFVWDSVSLEGNTFTFPEVQTLMDGVTVGGRSVQEQAQVTALADSARLLERLVQTGAFRLDKVTSDAINGVVSASESPEPGRFRGEGLVVTDIAVGLGGPGRYHPMPTERGAASLVRAHAEVVQALDGIEHPFERAAAYNLAMCRMQAYYDGNKRTARFMMNGELMSHGFDAVSVPARMRLQYNEAMVRLYLSGDATEVMGMMADLWREQNGSSARPGHRGGRKRASVAPPPASAELPGATPSTRLDRVLTPS
jgi:Fic family protein